MMQAPRQELSLDDGKGSQPTSMETGTSDSEGTPTISLATVPSPQELQKQQSSDIQITVKVLSASAARNATKSYFGGLVTGGDTNKPTYVPVDFYSFSNVS